MFFIKLIVFCTLFVTFLGNINTQNEPLLKQGAVTVILNDEMDEIFENLHHLIIQSGLDPYELPDQFLTVPYIGSLNLTKGWLQDLSTLSRDNDVTLTYSSQTKCLVLAIPIKFDDLLLYYGFGSKLFLLNTEGNMTGRISNVRINARISFNMTCHRAKVEDFDITNSGEISLQFQGNNLTDWMINKLTSTVEKFLHPIILRIIQYIFKGGIDSSVEEINQKIDDIFNNNSTYFYQQTI